MKKFLLPVAALLILGAGCASKPVAVQPNPEPQPVTPTPTQSTPTPSQPAPAQQKITITYYYSAKPEDKTKFCNGAQMDSAGYKKSLTQKGTKVLVGSISTIDKIKTALDLAITAGGWDDTYTLINNTTFNKGVVTMRPAGGWAGVSIFMCAWKPFVQKQLDQLTEVKTVVWEPRS